ncbi:putative membrane protein, partial [Vibrio parahaemolyticus IDH02640]
ILYFYIELP